MNLREIFERPCEAESVPAGAEGVFFAPSGRDTSVASHRQAAGGGLYAIRDHISAGRIKSILLPAKSSGALLPTTNFPGERPHERPCRDDQKFFNRA